MEPTIRQIRAWIADEEKASKEYSKYGYTDLARDESRHHSFMKRELAKKIKS